MAKFVHFDLELLNPSFASPLVDVLTELEHLRRLELGGSTPKATFLQLKEIFHKLESLASARIEGNHTTLADYIETTVDGDTTETDHIREISNIENAMEYIEGVIEPGTQLTEHLIRELHAMAVNDLSREGDKTPGAYRMGSVMIAKSNHLPPDPILVPSYMTELVNFINKDDPPKYDLIKVALAHHRFGWIHPFSNGNGRVVRLITYALLIKYGYNVKNGGRVLNPTAVFCNDREKYYAMLGCADIGTAASLDIWCTYVLQGILDELTKVDQLTNYVYLKQKILMPALDYATHRQTITPVEQAVLTEAIKMKIVKSADLAKAMPGLNSTQRTYQIRKLIEGKMLQPIYDGARQYTICFTNNHLLRAVIRSLMNEGYISDSLAG
jgi:Fic family protein